MSQQAAALMIRIVGVISMITAILFALSGVNDFTGANEIFFQIASSGGNGVAGLETPEAKLAMAIAGGVFATFITTRSEAVDSITNTVYPGFSSLWVGYF